MCLIYYWPLYKLDDCLIDRDEGVFKLYFLASENKNLLHNSILKCNISVHLSIKLHFQTVGQRQEKRWRMTSKNPQGMWEWHITLEMVHKQKTMMPGQVMCVDWELNYVPCEFDTKKNNTNSKCKEMPSEAWHSWQWERAGSDLWRHI